MSNSDSRQWLVAGAGYVGGRFAESAAAHGHDVVAVRRSPKPMAVDGTGSIECVAADLTKDASPIPLKPYDACFFCLSAAQRTPEAYRSSYHDALERLLHHLGNRLQGPIVYLSSTSVYPGDNGSIVDESSSVIADEAHPSYQLVAGERLALEASGYVARLTGIYGPGRNRLLRQVASGACELTHAPLWTNRIHRDDIVNAMLHFVDRRPAPGIYNVSDRRPVPYNTVIQWLAKALDVPAPSRLASDLPRRSNKQVLSAKLAATEFKWRYPDFRSGYQAMIDAGEAAA